MIPFDRIIPMDWERAHEDLEEMYRVIATAINGSQNEWTPTVDGSTTGAGTYTTQTGYYYRQGLLVDCWWHVIWSAHTGANDLRIALPFTIKNSADVWVGEVIGNSLAYPGGETQALLKGINNTKYAEVIATADGAASAKVQIANTGDLICHLRFISKDTI